MCLVLLQVDVAHLIDIPARPALFWMETDKKSILRRGEVKNRLGGGEEGRETVSVCNIWEKNKTVKKKEEMALLEMANEY